LADAHYLANLRTRALRSAARWRVEIVNARSEEKMLEIGVRRMGGTCAQWRIERLCTASQSRNVNKGSTEQMPPFTDS
ncbi:MAG TPA: hypothetical protein VMU34_07885, partial [Mycobacterium sp.]|nr:hypothetical protein [Mycobacterium sp.]